MTDITAKPFDWNDNLSEEAIESFESIRDDLPYCTCQNIGMALAKLELLEKQGCKVIDPSGSSSENSNKWIPVSEDLPKDAYGCIVTVLDVDLKTQNEFENILPYFVGYDGETWNNADGEPIPYEVIAWMKAPEPYMAEGSGEE